MNDVISRQTAIDEVCLSWCGVKHQECEHPFDIEKDDYYWCDGCETALQTLSNLPSVQPEGIKCVELSEEDYEKIAEQLRKSSLILTSAEPEQKVGKWIDHSDDGYVECPFCGSATNCDDNINELHYCFSCGAKMEVEG